ncbi:hypothetical protein MAM1_0514d10802 [Mucor ambiguus]|uniref:Uncharacterized protein n=1 Tax=Mucor ambiguus TaxID=91626 RepID=A0A0C9N958_9FUNG|nr:hypothetical protein MAM1_0514d10802 [Mucor ambiguus]
MESQDIYNNNHQLRGYHQQQQHYQQGSRADKASSWLSSQQDPLPDNPSKKISNINEKSLTDIDRLNTIYRIACQRDERISSWCKDVERHRLTSQESSSFTVFSNNQLNRVSSLQPVGAHLNSRNPPVLLASPFLQPMHMSSPVNTMQQTDHLSSAMYSTSDALKPPRSIVNASSQIGFSGFNQFAPEYIHPSQSFLSCSTHPNALQIVDSNQQIRFNSSLMLAKHNEPSIKADGVCKPMPSPPTSHNNRTPTWSQIAAMDTQQLTCGTFGATTMHVKARISTVPTKRTVPAIPLVNGNMDLSMTEASATPASASQTAQVASPIRESKYITDSLAFISSGARNDQDISVIRPYTILWNMSATDIYDILSRYKTLKLPEVTKLPQCVHILMDVKTGKSLKTAYVELELNTSSSIEIDYLIRNITIPQAQGYHKTVTRSSYDELCNHLFSEWKGEFINGMACPHTNFRDSSATQQSQHYIGQRDLQRLLNICRFFKIYYNRKCAERPFEFLITIIMSIPWKQPHAVKIAQRDIIYECYKLAIKALYKHLRRANHSFDDSLLPRMVRAAIICDGFTVRQKKAMLANAKIECPPDLESYIQEPFLNTDFLRQENK